MTRAVVTGAAGFVGSHLCERLVDEGFDVVGLDSLLTGDAANVAPLAAHERFRLETRDVTEPIEIEGPIDYVLHFASPASPIDYLAHPLATLKVGAFGTWRTLDLARANRATFMLASTSEVYGDPEVHPQPETYWGKVNPIGPRSVYDEAKRFAEALAMAHHRTDGLPVKLARIFNTYGPRMRKDDGRAVPTFIRQALRGEPLTIHGDGTQTRSLCYVDDLVDGIWLFLSSDETGPMNVGNPHEVTVKQLAELIVSIAGTGSELTFTERPVDDPELRCPDIARARDHLGWEPQVKLEAGLRKTLEWARRAWT